MYGEYKDSELEHLHEIELSMFKDFASLCEENGIEYFAISGTAIGTIRHQGFIPWDDDIDVAVLREDYVRFVKAMKKDKAFCEKYDLWGPDRPHKYYNLQPTLMRKGTTFVHKNAKAAGFKPGISMDIFIYDNIPEDRAEAEKVIKKAQFYKILYLTRNINFFKLLEGESNIQKIKNMILGFVRIGLRMIPNSERLLYRHFMSYATKYRGKTDWYTCFFDPGASIMHININEAFPTIQTPFEDTQMRVLKNYDAQLKQHMGEYMTIPPEDKRTNHYPEELDFGEL